MLVVANQPFVDAQGGNVLRVAGDRFECDDARARELAGYRLVAIAAEQPEPKRAPRKRAAKKGA